MEWLDKLGAGDGVIICYHNSTALKKVTRLTKTQIVIGTGLQEEKFNRKTGSLVGGGAWTSVVLKEATPAAVSELRAAIHEQKARAAARDLGARGSSLKITVEEQEAILKIYAGVMARESD